MAQLLNGSIRQLRWGHGGSIAQLNVVNVDECDKCENVVVGF
jgi:hypothetical protein